MCKLCHMPVYKQPILLFVFTMSTAFAFGQKQKHNSLAYVVNAIAESNVYEISYIVGYAGIISKQYQRSQLLSSLATEQQLLDIAAHHKNAVVRLYALQVLRQKKIPVPEALLQQFQNDHTNIKVLKGCEADEKSVNALYGQDLNFSFTLEN